MAYRTVSTPTILVVAGTIPAHLMAREKQGKYRQSKRGLEVNKKELREIQGLAKRMRRVREGKMDEKTH